MYRGRAVDSKGIQEAITQISDVLGQVSRSRDLLLIVAGRQASGICLYCFCIRKNIPVILLPEDASCEYVNHCIDRYRPSWVCTPSEFSMDRERKVCHKWEQYDLWQAVPDHGEGCGLHIARDLAVLLPTSGSTGDIKMVMLSYKNLRANAESIQKSLQIDSWERAAVLLPISYSYGLSVVNSTLLAGGTLLVPEDPVYDPRCWDFLESYGVTAICGVPYSYELYFRFRIFDRKLDTLRVMTQAGGRMGLELKKRVLAESRKRNAHFAVMYGQTEATARISCFFLDDAEDKIASVGKVIPGGQLSVFHPDSRGIGELVYQGDNIFMGYACSREDLQDRGVEYKDSARRLYTGDIGNIDQDGYIYLTGRKARFVKLYGKRVSLDSLEETLYSLTGKQLVCVQGNAKQERIFILREGRDWTREEEAGILQEIPVLRDYIVCVSIPKFPRRENGKIDYGKIQKIMENVHD